MTEPTFHPTPGKADCYVTVVLPLAVGQPYTYRVPEEWVSAVVPGKRVEVQFGKNRHYTALIWTVITEAPKGHKPKPILSVLDDEPLIGSAQQALWEWMSRYYCCSLGEVMHAALPANLKLASETIVTLSPLFADDYTMLDDQEYLIAEALSIQEQLTIEDIRQIINQKTVYPLIRRLLDKKVIYLQEDLKEKYKPKTIGCARLAEPFAGNPKLLEEAFARLNRSTRQMEALLAYLQLAKKQEFVRKEDIYQMAQVDSAVLKALEKKEILELYEREVSRLGTYAEETVDADELSGQQVEALAQIREAFAEKQVTLLQGVTGSGKTRVYTELIQETIARGQQVLYLLPEIALTTQIISRLQRVFGNDIGVYHSRLNNNERVEMWTAVQNGKPLVLGARSALLLPFAQLGLIIVDEEHDPSYKQQDPNPRYQGRDAAIYLGQITDAKVLLGTATPSLESFFNARTGKYGWVLMPERFGGLQLPEVTIVDVKKEIREQTMHSHFSTALIEAIKVTLAEGEQVILFQNRRGYAPAYRCLNCGWHAECIHCDVSLTYHQHFQSLKCHYCGYQTKPPPACPACGGKQLSLQGFGTEKIEDELKVFLPEARIGRMDIDTVRSKNAHAKIINDFEEGRLQILVGTQMVTKGLDFERVGLVGVLSADQLLQFPDFRAGERAFQLMMQVSGRAGRKNRQGKVLIQAMNTDSAVLGDVLRGDMENFFQREIQERRQFIYPPFSRLIRVTLKHKKPEVVNEAGKLYAKAIKGKLGERVRGPAVPYVGRVRGYYLLDFLIKLERNNELIRQAKALLLEAEAELHNQQGLSGVRINIDVDPA